jgi:hypothetical protein
MLLLTYDPIGSLPQVCFSLPPRGYSCPRASILVGAEYGYVVVVDEGYAGPRHYIKRLALVDQARELVRTIDSIAAARLVTCTPTSSWAG